MDLNKQQTTATAVSYTAVTDSLYPIGWGQSAGIVFTNVNVLNREVPPLSMSGFQFITAVCEVSLPGAWMTFSSMAQVSHGLISYSVRRE